MAQCKAFHPNLDYILLRADAMPARRGGEIPFHLVSLSS